MKRIIFLVILMVFSVCVYCQNSKTAFDIYGGVGVSKLDSRITSTHSTISPDPNLGIALGGGLYFGNVGFNLEIGGFSIKDSDTFSQLTTAGGQESSTFGWVAIPSIGGKYELENFELNLNLGYAFAAASRSISDCVDCKSEKVTINNGATLRPRLIYHFSKMYLFGSYEHYFSDHMQSLFLFGFGFRSNR